MKKKIAFIIVLMVLLAGSVFAQNTFNKETLLRDVLQRVGSNYEEVIAKNGKPLAQTTKFKHGIATAKYLIYSGMQIIISISDNLTSVETVYIYDPQFELVKGVSVGANINDALKILGDDYRKTSTPSVYTFERFLNNYIISLISYEDIVTEIVFSDVTGYM